MDKTVKFNIKVISNGKSVFHEIEVGADDFREAVSRVNDEIKEAVRMELIVITSPHAPQNLAKTATNKLMSHSPKPRPRTEMTNVRIATKTDHSADMPTTLDSTKDPIDKNKLTISYHH